MEETLIQELLIGSSNVLTELKEKSGVLIGFLELAKKLDALPKMEKRFYENKRSLFQATSVGREMSIIENILKEFFGPPVKHAENPLPITLKLNNSVKHLNGVKKDQTFFLLQLKYGEFYGALWPWTKDPRKIEIHLGYCAENMEREDYTALENLVRRSLSHKAFNTMDTSIGGQIHGISLPSFLQMSEMEGATLTLKITAQRRHGHLFLSEGSLVAAETAGLRGLEAAYRIISWDDPVIQIEKSDEERPDEIRLPLMHVLMESLKKKDEDEYDNEGDIRGPSSKASVHEASDGDGAAHPPDAALAPPEPEKHKDEAPAPSIPADETKPAKRAFPWRVAVPAILAIIAMGSGGLFYVNVRKAAKAYERFVGRVEALRGEEEKTALLMDYLETARHGKYAADAERRLKEIQARIEARDYENTRQSVAGLALDEAYVANASRLYRNFLAKHPNGKFSDAVRQAMESVRDTLDQACYEKVISAEGLSFSRRFETYHQYLTLLPHGRHRQAVKQLISKMGDEYYAYIRSEIPNCETARRWDDCITLCDNFIAVFSTNPELSEVETARAALVEQKAFDRLQEQVREAGDDLDTVRKLYTGYLDTDPPSSQRIQVQKALSRIDGQIAYRQSWEAVRTFAGDSRKQHAVRIGKLEEFIIDNPTGRYRKAAETLLAGLRNEQKKARITQQKVTPRTEEQSKPQQTTQPAEQETQRIRQLQSLMITKLAPLSRRYRSSNNGIVKDLRTGLEWRVLDSWQQTRRCLNYAAAQVFVDTLNKGEDQGWRLPTSSELAALYKSDPPFPDEGAPWYWTSEAFVKGYHRVVNIVTTVPERVYKRSFLNEEQCGAVRAVRP